MFLLYNVNNGIRKKEITNINFKNIPKKYRPVPFWSWNEKLDTDETSAQIRMMNEAGIGGFFMHARGGLQTEYLGEESILVQITTNGACMPHYEYLTIPAMDWLFRPIRECLTPLQVSSVAQQLDKEAVLSETFALCGHNVSFAELKGIYEWQMVRGINLLCQHLEGYSIRGIRKRDYPPAMYCQQPWWSEYKKFNNLASRKGMILATGKINPEVLVLHPQTTAWAMFDNKNHEPIENLNKKFLALIKSLEEKHIPFHLGDETIIERHAKVENGKIIIGSQAYSKVITDYCEVLLPATEKILTEYKAQGGVIVSADDLEANNVTDEPTITYTVRYADDYTAHFFVNTSPDRKVANINVQGKRLDCYSGEMHTFDGVHEFEPWGSLMIIEEGSANAEHIPSEKNIVKLSGSFEIQGEVENAITLDKCDYYFDGELQEKNGYVLNICERANALERLVKIHQDYHINIIDIPSSLDLVCETPDIFKISVNGVEIEKNIKGYFVDKSFERINIAKYVKQGENIISFDCDFVQSEQFYKDRRNSFIFESEKNKLAYDMEIEAIYLVGNFSVNTPGKWTALGKRDFRYSGDFEIAAPKKTVSLKHIEQNGFPFFCGALKLVGEIEISGDNSVLELDTHGINAVKVKINNFESTLLTDTKLSIPDSIEKGTHKIELTLINNLHNLLEPHHSKAGELTTVGPWVFFIYPSLNGSRFLLLPHP